jgi:hypothetical protein
MAPRQRAGVARGAGYADGGSGRQAAGREGACQWIALDCAWLIERQLIPLLSPHFGQSG